MVIGLDSLFQILVNLPGLLAIVVLLWCLAAAVALYFRKQEKADVAALLAGKTQEQKEKSKSYTDSDLAWLNSSLGQSCLLSC